MTNEEALDWLIHKISIDVQNSRDIQKGIECLETCKNALEKQIPKKSINWLGKMIICPRCNRADYIKPLESYCKFCGQAIDWSDWSDEE